MMNAVSNHELRIEVRRLLSAWLGIVLLGALEFGLALLPLPHAIRPLIIAPAIAMIAAVALQFMDLKRGPAIVRAFAVAALFWLLVLLVLGSCDPFSRTDYLVKSPATQATPAASPAR